MTNSSDNAGDLDVRLKERDCQKPHNFNGVCCGAPVCCRIENEHPSKFQGAKKDPEDTSRVSGLRAEQRVGGYEQAVLVPHLLTNEEK